ncbi:MULTISPECIES: LacI family DNA-binding transcriptional regulator [unclassified Paenibacillus]|uniref:LacI family DNA-binding transcriptional regulator n=1 Tax=unclassified Paenibacillus TaxID=185978 RepID=UPI001AE2A71D|nr:MULTISPECIES: LacI family DNA-binding transcriptional regulator [unclassified Paenibacillus]MBP1153748.1 LacI family kdg operon repressor/LacI family transcriptional regulator [Paenibacillus sp. PvP091]MBP1170867.1 LacI family kdg operon repressor/LacI family transcriptional regulator [Paenibacillus sp. PvR098]MBP2441895.1 LacI family kdg operon repressor/LacI family transcriptional regulator [Paenibacillus sp. PvP052]
MKVTIDDVALKAGVSKATVSRVLNKNYQYIAEDTKERVLKAIEQLDYRPNALAKGLKSMKTNVMGLVLSNLRNPFWSQVLEGIEDVCKHYGYNLMIANSRDSLESEEEHIRGFGLRKVDGIIVNPTTGLNPLFQTLSQKQFPLVFLNRKVEGVTADTVVVDNIKGSRMAVEHLVRLHKRKIAIFLYPPNGISPRLERIEGYRIAMEENGLPVQPDWIKIVRNKEECQTEIGKLLETGLPDAIFATSSILTLEILDALKELGLSVPKDIAVLGYDETAWAKHLDPPMTTIEQPAYEMGKVSAERLIRRVNNKTDSALETILLEPTLIVRRSCGEALR